MREALYAAKIISYAQGYMLLKPARKEFGWQLPYGSIALMWREGCIIRAAFLDKIKEAYDTQPDLTNLDWLPTSRNRCKMPRQPGGGSSSRRWNSASRSRPCPALWPSSMATAASGCRPICCRHREIISARIPMNAWTNRAVSFSIPIGPAVVETYSYDL